jgi:DUF1680 family protein
MRKSSITFYLLIPLLAWGCHSSGTEQQPATKKIRQVDFSQVTINDDFWSPRLERHATTTLPVCIDQIENKTGRIRNFMNAAKDEGEHSGIFYDDSDVYKALEGMAYSLVNKPDPELEKKCDKWIDLFVAAQEEDGYINTFYSLTGLENRWTDMDKHEMYCAGHLLEAAIAYYKATGKDKLLKAATRMIEHMMSQFGPGKRHWVPGHEEIELALVKLHEVTGEKKYLDFAYWLLEERGHGYGNRGPNGPWNRQYYQDELPVRELSKITGHAVRAMYLFCGMADVAALTGEKDYIEALDRLWDDVVLRKMYITGGIGSSRQNEGFTRPYDLPNYEAYCETCASVGMVLWNCRMHQLTGDSKYTDVLERSLYNGALAGISLEGDRFFYVNPLASRGDHHRKEWYGTACCPSQISRFLPSVGNYIYGVSGDALWINLYIGSSAKIDLGKESLTLKQQTRYPWDGKVEISMEELKKTLRKEMRLRIPGWCKSYSITVNGEKLENVPVEQGYAVIERSWKRGDKVSLTLEMPVEVIQADPRVTANAGKRAIQRGPLVYCVEEVDNPSFDGINLTADTRYIGQKATMLTDEVVVIDALHGEDTIRFVPYYLWDNRAPGQMKVWVDYRD